MTKRQYRRFTKEFKLEVSKRYQKGWAQFVYDEYVIE
jgi:hypothetical protein